MESNVIKVGMADLKIAHPSDVLVTLGLGSCVGICFFDIKTKIIGLAHIMLPSKDQTRRNSNLAKFADSGIELLLQQMIEAGVDKKNIIAKIAGGAQMFSFSSTSDIIKIGERNVIATKEKLSELKIPIVAEDTGGNFGRTIELYSETGDLLIKTIGYGVSRI